MKKFKRGDVIMANDGMNQYGFTNQRNLFLAVVNESPDPGAGDDYIRVDTLVMFCKQKHYHLFHYFSFPDYFDFPYDAPPSLPRPFTLAPAFHPSNLNQSKETQFLGDFYDIRIQSYSIRASHFRLYSRKAYDRDIDDHFSSRFGYKREHLSVFLDALDARLNQIPTPIPRTPSFDPL